MDLFLTTRKKFVTVWLCMLTRVISVIIPQYIQISNKKKNIQGHGHCKHSMNTHVFITIIISLIYQHSNIQKLWVSPRVPQFAIESRENEATERSLGANASKFGKTFGKCYQHRTPFFPNCNSQQEQKKS